MKLLFSSIVLASVTIGPLGASADAGARPIRPELARVLDASDPGASHVILATGPDAAIVAASARRVGLTVVEVVARAGVVTAFGTREAIVALHRQAGVDSVEANVQLVPAVDSSSLATGVEAARRDPAFSDLGRPDGTPWDGSGVSIAIIDSGFDARHEMFVSEGASKFDLNLRQACSVPDLFIVSGAPETQPCSEWIPVADGDGSGHGTHVAGIAAGYESVTPSGRTLSGVAPGARLIGLGGGIAIHETNVVGALNWVLEHHDDPCGDGSCPPIRVVNNSWGWPACSVVPCLQGQEDQDYDPSLAVNKVVTALAEDGVVVVFAAANEGGDGSQNRVQWFAMNPTPGVIGVANYNDDDVGDQAAAMSSSSSRGRRGSPATYPDIAAPGTQVRSACPPARFNCILGAGLADGEYTALSGTSMASPHLAGVVAVLLEADPTLTPAEVEDLLEDTARTVGDPDEYEPDVYTDHTGAIRGNPDDLTSYAAGHGLVDLVAALDALQGDGARAAPLVCPPAMETVMIDDPVGDDRIMSLIPPSVHDSQRDITRVALAWDDSTHNLVIEVELDDLTPTPTTNLLYAVDLSIDGRIVNLDATRGAADPGTFSVFRGEVTVRGSFDPVTDVVRYVVTPSWEARGAALSEVFTDSALGGTGTRHDRTTGACTIRGSLT